MSALRALLAAAALTLAAITPASAAYRITHDNGGPIWAYIDKYNALRNAGGTVIIDGLCLSSCALIAGLMPAERVCVTPYGQLGFHSASTAHHFDSEATRMVWQMYPETVRALLRERGWDGHSEHAEMIYIEGAELRSLFAACASH